MESTSQTAPWLTGPRFGMRAPRLADADHADRWWIGDGPRDPAVIRRALARREAIPWGGNPLITLVIIDTTTGEIAGGVLVTRAMNRTARLDLLVAPDRPDRAAVLREALGRLVPWLLEEVGLMTAWLETAADDDALLAGARAAGMSIATRRREHIARPGGRVDLLQLQRVNREWGRYAG